MHPWDAFMGPDLSWAEGSNYSPHCFFLLYLLPPVPRG